MRIVSSSSSEGIYFVAYSSVAASTARVTDHTTGGFTAHFSKGGAAITTAAVSFAVVDATSMPGVYYMGILDSTLTALPAGIDSRELVIHIAGSMDSVTRTVELYRRTATTGVTLALNSSGKIADVESILAKVTSVDTDIDTALTRLSSLGTHVDTIVSKVSSIDTDIDTAITNIAAIKVETTAIKAKTDSLTYTQAGKVDANIHYVNNVQVTGTGSTTDPWGP